MKKILLIIFMSLGLFPYETNSLAFYSQGKPFFVEISTDWCFACKMLKPTVEQLISEYGSEVEFVLLDPSNEDKAKIAEQKAQEYGITDFYNKNKNAFPTVGILRADGMQEKIIVGANDKHSYTEVLDRLLGKTDIAKDEPKTEEPNEEIITGRPPLTEPLNRPNLPNILDRPLEVISSGRPPELTFWAAGQTIPTYAYFQYLVLPKCSANNNILCNNLTNTTNPLNTNPPSQVPIFKPWTPNATRDEKGLHF